MYLYICAHNIHLYSEAVASEFQLHHLQRAYEMLKIFVEYVANMKYSVNDKQ